MKVADSPVVSIVLLEVLLASEHLAPQLGRAESMKKQDAREHGELPCRIRERHRSRRLQAPRICTSPWAVTRFASICSSTSARSSGRSRSARSSRRIAELLAAAAGAPVQPQPFRPVLRGRLLAGRGAQYLEHALHGGDGEGPDSVLQLWSVPHKIEGRYLTPWLAELKQQPPTGPPAEAGDLEIEVQLPTGHDALTLDPYSPMPAR